VDLTESGDLEMTGHAYMFYLDYDDPEKISYEVWLVDNEENYVKLDTQLYDDGFDYKSMLGSKYELNHICFKANGNILDLDGNYTVYLKMSNSSAEGEFMQIAEAPGFGIDLPQRTISEKEYSFTVSGIRERLALTVKKIEE